VGGYVSYRCRYCGYEQAEIALGRGREPNLALELFHCRHCRSVGSTWVRAGEQPLCGHCYDEAVDLLDPATTKFACPRCGEDGRFTPAEGEWR